MTAAKIGHSQDKKNSGGSFKFNSPASKTDTKTTTKPKKQDTPSKPVPNPSVTKKTSKKDNGDDRKVVKDTKPSARQALVSKSAKDKNVKGQKGLFGIGLNWW